MLCERCNERNASVTFTQIINGRKTEMHLCPECAKQMQIMPNFGELSNIIGSEFGMNNFLTDVVNSMNAFLQPSMASLTKGVQVFDDKCPNCGYQYGDFIHSGMLGCPECYESFSTSLGPILQRLHGSRIHTGKVAGEKGDKAETVEQKIQKLEGKLKQAIEVEDYENAAKIRDELKVLKSSIENEGTNEKDKKEQKGENK